MWQQKLAATEVGLFHWQDEDSRHAETSSVTKASGETKFHNPALAAIRASQQSQDLASRSDLNGSEDGAHERKFKREDDSEPSTPETHLKRRISEVSDAELQPQRNHHHIHHQPQQRAPSPPIPSYSSESTYPPVLHPSLDHLSPSPPPKRRPDPNEDTIGSDLDDSQDEGDIDPEDEDENMPLMLCLYEKVHRTKNKWRANMNHGIVCIDGREWVFEKGNGEYEW